MNAAEARIYAAAFSAASVKFDGSPNDDIRVLRAAAEAVQRYQRLRVKVEPNQMGYDEHLLIAFDSKL